MREAPGGPNRTQILSSFTEDHREAIGAFLEKRPPHFTHR